MENQINLDSFHDSIGNRFQDVNCNNVVVTIL